MADRTESLDRRCCYTRDPMDRDREENPSLSSLSWLRDEKIRLRSRVADVEGVRWKRKREMHSAEAGLKTFN